MGLYAETYYGVKLNANFTMTDELLCKIENNGYIYATDDHAVYIEASLMLEAGIWGLKKTDKENKIIIRSDEPQYERTHEIPMDFINRFKQFLIDNGIDGQPRWIASVDSTLDLINKY